MPGTDARYGVPRSGALFRCYGRGPLDAGPPLRPGAGPLLGHKTIKNKRKEEESNRHAGPPSTGRPSDARYGPPRSGAPFRCHGQGPLDAGLPLRPGAEPLLGHKNNQKQKKGGTIESPRGAPKARVPLQISGLPRTPL